MSTKCRKVVDIVNLSKQTIVITKITLMTAFLVAASYLVIPLPFAVAAISVQTLAVNLIALLLPPVQAGLSIAIYILLGAIGLPVFNGGNGGIGYLLGPTGGFFAGFIAAVVLISLLKGKKYSLVRYSLVTVFVGVPVIYLFALGWMVCVTGMPIRDAFLVGCAPFLLGDAAKCVVAGVVARPLLKVMNQYEENRVLSEKTV